MPMDGSEVNGMVKIECEKCHVIGYLQQLGNYYRVRHYEGISDSTGKSTFSYHQQGKEYALSQLALLRKGAENFKGNTANIKETEAEHSNPKMMEKCSRGLEPKLRDSSLNQQTEGGRSLAWFRTSACHVDDPGSNPGDRTITLFS